jgi:hypothetical protein
VLGRDGVVEAQTALHIAIHSTTGA